LLSQVISYTQAIFNIGSIENIQAGPWGLGMYLDDNARLDDVFFCK